ncbi:hypothetical protein ABZT47_11645 [Sphaerisporangium sp. NPDC005289]|uniref:aggregation-promoting factor C-terminal-like domain-containing protein n=1 Tax=Sphaerisporangium sp. NPDC005289 TaxID=3155247 RepID=UPI0033A8BB31
MDSNRAFRGAVAAVIAATVLNGTAGAAQAIAESEATPGSTTVGAAERAVPDTGPAEPVSAAPDGARSHTTTAWPGISAWSLSRPRVPVWTRAGLTTGLVEAARPAKAGRTATAARTAMAGRAATAATTAGAAKKAGAVKKAGAARAATTARARAASGTARKAAVVHRGTWRTSARPQIRAWAPTTPKGRNKAIAYRLLTQRAWPVTQFRCLDSLWTRESNWNHRAQNPSSGAYGIPQALPGRKMVGIGHDWRVNPATQIRWGLNYIKGRYGSPCGAWGHFRSHNWY